MIRGLIPGLRRLGVLAALAGPALAQTPTQQPTPQQLQQLQFLGQNPELVRQQLLRSGLTTDQIRARLLSSGMSPSALDRFLLPGADTLGTPLLGHETLRALEELGIARLHAQGLEFVPVDTGLVVSVLRARSAEGRLQPFGLDVFRTTTRFQPVLSGPVPLSYKVGPGDELVLILTGDVEGVYQLVVTREGFIVIPRVGQIPVNNLTMDRLNLVLRERLGQSFSAIRTGAARFDLTITRLRTNQVYVVGEVAQPGAYRLASVATVLNAIYAAGGLTERSSFREMAVRRQGEVVATLDFYDYLLHGDTGGDIVLEQGDVVFVPVRGIRASITGAVIRPAIYEIKPGETLDDLIQAAGGFQAEADLRRLAVHRIIPAPQRAPGPLPRVVIDVPLQTDVGTIAQPDSADGRSAAPEASAAGITVPPLALQDGDSVAVDSITTVGRSLTVSVVGMVRKPGAYAWRQGMRLRDLVLLARGPVVGADLREAELARLPADRSRGQLAEVLRVPLDSSYLFERDSAGAYLGVAGVTFPSSGSAPDVPLRPYDQVTIFQQPEFDLQRSVTITGEVAYPGTYALKRKDEQLSDLVKRAGGPLPTAYVLGARFYRLEHRTGEPGQPVTEVKRVNVEVNVALQRGGSADVILQPGDSLHVPQYNPTVQVEGAVNAPSSVLYREGAGLDHYIGNAGGYARNADKGRISVRYANGSARVTGRFLVFSSKPKPGPGSVITVPSKPEGQPFNVAGFLAALASLSGSAVAIVAILAK